MSRLDGEGVCTKQWLEDIRRAAEAAIDAAPAAQGYIMAHLGKVRPQLAIFMANVLCAVARNGGTLAITARFAGTHEAAEVIVKAL